MDQAARPVVRAQLTATRVVALSKLQPVTSPGNVGALLIGAAIAPSGGATGGCASAVPAPTPRASGTAASAAAIARRFTVRPRQAVERRSPGRRRSGGDCLHEWGPACAA
jgi:hypothetical protein